MSARREVPALPASTMAQMLRERAQRHPQVTAIRQKDFGIWNPIDWQTYYRRAAHVGHGLRALGL
ncbi:MAG: long-chain fatty acid--CoA ligase, partial [Gammaproteobacteria bacterium]